MKEDQLDMSLKILIPTPQTTTEKDISVEKL